MSDPFLPPPTPSERPYLAPPVWSPPPPPKKGHKLRNGLLIGGGVVAAIVVISVIAAPDATKQGFEDGAGIGNTATTIAPEAPVVTLADEPVTDAPSITASDVPAWVNDETLAWSTEIADLMDDTASLSNDMVSALQDGDIAEATSVAQELHLMWVTAPDVPAGVPIATEYNALRDSAVDSFGTTVDALVELDTDKMQQATVKLGHTTDLLTSFTDEIVSMTDELKALQG